VSKGKGRVIQDRAKKLPRNRRKELPDQKKKSSCKVYASPSRGKVGKGGGAVEEGSTKNVGERDISSESMERENHRINLTSMKLRSNEIKIPLIDKRKGFLKQER